MRRVWIEIQFAFCVFQDYKKSPSMRRVWIEMGTAALPTLSPASPSMRRVWIEISRLSHVKVWMAVTLHAEGVD